MFLWQRAYLRQNCLFTLRESFPLCQCQAARLAPSQLYLHLVHSIFYLCLSIFLSQEFWLNDRKQDWKQETKDPTAQNIVKCKTLCQKITEIGACAKDDLKYKCEHCHPFGLEDLNFLLNQVIVWNNVKQMAPNQKLNKVKAINGE